MLARKRCDAQDISAYVSTRVFDGVRRMTPVAAAKHRARLQKVRSKKALALTVKRELQPA